MTALRFWASLSFRMHRISNLCDKETQDLPSMSRLDQAASQERNQSQGLRLRGASGLTLTELRGGHVLKVLQQKGAT